MTSSVSWGHRRGPEVLTDMLSIIGSECNLLVTFWAELSAMLDFLCTTGVIMLFHVLSVILGFLKVNSFVVTPAKGQTRHFLSAFFICSKVFTRNKSKKFVLYFFRKKWIRWDNIFSVYSHHKSSNNDSLVRMLLADDEFFILCPNLFLRDQLGFQTSDVWVPNENMLAWPEDEEGKRKAKQVEPEKSRTWI